MVPNLALCTEQVPFGSPVFANRVKIKGHHVLRGETKNLIAVIGSEVRLSFVEIHGVWLHEVNRQVWRGVLGLSVNVCKTVQRRRIHTEEDVGGIVSEVEGFNVEIAPSYGCIIPRSTVPFTRESNAINHGFNDAAGGRVCHSRVGPEVLEIRRKVEVDGTVDVGEMNLEQNVPVFIVTAVLVQTVPPVPIASFGDVQRLPSSRKARVVGI